MTPLFASGNCATLRGDYFYRPSFEGGSFIPFRLLHPLLPPFNVHRFLLADTRGGKHARAENGNWGGTIS